MLPYQARVAGRWADESSATEDHPRPLGRDESADGHPGLGRRINDDEDDAHGHRDPLSRALSDVQAFGPCGF